MDKERSLDSIILAETQDDERLDAIFKPFRDEVKKLRETVKYFHPEWLDDSIRPEKESYGPWRKDKYVRINDLLEEIVPKLVVAIKKDDVFGMGEVAKDLFEVNRDPKYSIFLGHDTTLMGKNSTHELGYACASNLVEPDAELMARTILSALATIAYRIEYYVNYQK